MRIISGRFKGSNLKMPKGIRPTQNKTRKAVFDILGDICGLSFLDLFAGSGLVGIEALSYGAGKVILVESNNRVLKILQENIANICLDDPIKESILVFPIDAHKAISRFCENRELFDIIFLDPPYYPVRDDIRQGRLISNGASQACHVKAKTPKASSSFSVAKKTLQILDGHDILTPSGLVLIQHYKRDILPESLKNLSLHKQYKYGDTLLSLYKKISDFE